MKWALLRSLGLGLFLLIFSLGIGFSQSTTSWTENFDSFESGSSILEKDDWKGFVGFPGELKPSATILANVGIDGSKALAITHGEEFRTDNWGLQFQLPLSHESGAVWIQCKFKPPAEWAGGLTVDARGPERSAILMRLAASPFENRATKSTELRWHCTWTRPHWRLYTLSELDAERWYTLTARLDLDGRSVAAWVDDQPLAEEAPLSAEGAFTQIHLGFGGLGETPALVDDLSIGTEAPDGFEAPDLLPEPEPGLIFRFAGLGDPQLGMSDYETDKIRFGLAVDQINHSGSELSLILGDMVHANKDEKSYQDLAALAEDLNQPTYIRGNHEDLDLFQKYFNAESNYVLVHKGLRFVVVDAIGNQRGLTQEQLAWIETEFTAASENSEEIVLALHVSPWQDNKKGAGDYNQIGPGRDRLRELMKEHDVLLCLSGHYHTGLWGAKEEETHYLVLGGTARVSGGAFGWCLFDVYPDRIVMHQKPLFFGYEKEGSKAIHGLQDWIPYETLRKTYPYIQQGPLTIPRLRPAEN